MRTPRPVVARTPDRNAALSAEGVRCLQTSLTMLLLAALLTAPLYVVSEGMAHLWRVLWINGGTAGVMGVLLLLVRRGYARLVSGLVVWGLLGLISGLAALNGEPILINVVNFVAVLVLAHVLLAGGRVWLVGLVGAVAMTAIAYHQALVPPEPQGRQGFVAMIGQFLPQFILITLLLRAGSRAQVVEDPHGTNLGSALRRDEGSMLRSPPA